MPVPPSHGQSRSKVDLNGFSCLTCRQRKVKCDRRCPCSNCVKTETECNFVAPVRGKRKRTARLPREGLHAKLKRYEELLKSFGVQLEPSSNGHETDSGSEMASQLDIEMSDDARPRSRERDDPYGLEESKPLLVGKEGTSRYVESSLWSSLGHNFEHTGVDGPDGPLDGPDIPEGDILFSSAEQGNIILENLASLHPPIQIIHKLQQVFTDRIDPLMKILHLPTFWPLLTKVVQNPQTATKSVEALAFSFYLATISALEENECLHTLEAGKSFLYSRYRRAARQALVNAGLLSTSSPVTLQAFAVFMMGVRSCYRFDTLFILSGVAIRLARKMGFHRDGLSLGLSPFESEMRRRLWWHLVHTDFRMADVLDSRPSMDLFACDTKMPLNVMDEDLYPEMIDSPPERNGITSIVVCRLRCEIIEFLRKFSGLSSSSDFRWDVLSSRDFPVSKKDSLIKEMEDLLEQKYLRYCDLAESLHVLVSIMVRSSIGKMKLFAHNPRRYAETGNKIPESERNIVFKNATKMLEYATLVPGNPSLEKYMWQYSACYLWNLILYVLIEARHRKTGPEVDRVWELIGIVLFKYPETFERSSRAVYSALRKWTLEVWDDYIAAMQAAKLPDPITPEYIQTMRQCPEPPSVAAGAIGEAVFDKPSKGQQEADTIEVDKASYNSNIQQARKSNDETCTLADLDAPLIESFDFSNLLTFETNPDEWLQWEQLIAEEGGFSAVS